MVPLGDRAALAGDCMQLAYKLARDRHERFVRQVQALEDECFGGAAFPVRPARARR